jgi:uncharacterized protein with GYD domain
MATFITTVQFTEQGIKAVRDTREMVEAGEYEGVVSKWAAEAKRR